MTDNRPTPGPGPTEIVWDWMRRHPELLPLFRASSGRPDGDLADHVTHYLLPSFPASAAVAALAHAALAEVDWEQVRRRLAPPADGRE